MLSPRRKKEHKDTNIPHLSTLPLTGYVRRLLSDPVVVREIKASGEGKGRLKYLTSFQALRFLKLGNNSDDPI